MDVDQQLSVLLHEQASISSIPYTTGSKLQTDDRTTPPIEDYAMFEKAIVEKVNQVYLTLGDGQKEATYQQALLQELMRLGLTVNEEMSIDIQYDGNVVGKRKADLVVAFGNGHKCILELKAVKSGGLVSKHAKQLQYYMASFQIPFGLLINFPKSMEFPELDVAMQNRFSIKKLQALKEIKISYNLGKAAEPEIHSFVMEDCVTTPPDNDSEDNETNPKK